MAGQHPQSSDEILDFVRQAVAEKKTIEIAGAGTKRSLGRPATADWRLDLSQHCGITLYEPEELVMSARAGTSLAEIEAALGTHRQMLAFEPPDLGPLWGAQAGAATLGGLVAAGLSGPRRVKAGAVRDHVLGIAAISGRGEAFKSGGRVVKNVTGYDLSKLMTASFGTLAVLSEITLKLAPRPETALTLVIEGLHHERAGAAMRRALASPCDVSAAAHMETGAENPLTAFRLEGFGASVKDRAQALIALLRDFGAPAPLDETQGAGWWRAVRNLEAFSPTPEQILWRLSLPPSEGAALLARVREAAPEARALFDWGGALLWISLAGSDPQGGLIHGLAAAAGGHATLFRAPDEARAKEDVFSPLPPALEDLTRRVKEQFDPLHLLNPGRLYSWC